MLVESVKRELTPMMIAAIIVGAFGMLMFFFLGKSLATTSPESSSSTSSKTAASATATVELSETQWAAPHFLVHPNGSSLSDFRCF